MTRPAPHPRFLAPFSGLIAAFGVGLCLLLLMVAAQAQQATQTSLQQLIWEERFTEAREALAKLPQGKERSRLQRVLDEAETDALCDEAEALIRSGEATKALESLALVIERLGMQRASSQRALSLFALASQMVNQASTDQVLSNRLKASLQRDDARLAGRQTTISDRKTEIDQLFQQATEVARQVADDARAELNSRAENNATQGRKYLRRVEALVDSLELLLPRNEFDVLKANSKTRIDTLEASYSADLARLFYFQRNFSRALKETQQGMMFVPDDSKLLDFLTRISMMSATRRLLGGQGQNPGFNRTDSSK